MKSVYLIIALGIVLGFTSCGGNTNNNTHTHEDGCVHENHATETAKPTEQETFKVEADSSAACDEHDHDHSHDHNHDHSGHNHKH